MLINCCEIFWSLFVLCNCQLLFKLFTVFRRKGKVRRKSRYRMLDEDEQEILELHLPKSGNNHYLFQLLNLYYAFNRKYYSVYWNGIKYICGFLKAVLPISPRWALMILQGAVA